MKPSESATSERETSMFSALADPTRREILRLLRRSSLAAGAISEAFELSKPTLSHHLKILREAGLVRAERRGTSQIYTLQSNVLEDAAALLFELVQGTPTTTRTRKRTP